MTKEKGKGIISEDRLKNINILDLFDPLTAATPTGKDNSLEYAGDFKSRAYKDKKTARKTKTRIKEESLAEILPKLPAPGEAIHIISNGTFDFFTYIPHIAGILKGGVIFHGSTWTMNRNNVLDLLELYDNKQIKKISILTGLYFRQRESSVYAMLVQGITKRKQRYKCAQNHAKVTLLQKGKNYIAIEGSANYTANPRIENFIVMNDRKIYEFHKEWIEYILSGGKTKKGDNGKKKKQKKKQKKKP